MNRSSVRFRQAAPPLTCAFALRTGKNRRPIHFLVSIVGTFIGVRLRFRDCQKNGVIGPDTPSLLGGKDQS
jgi:hypothetical protein